MFNYNFAVRVTGKSSSNKKVSKLIFKYRYGQVTSKFDIDSKKLHEDIAKKIKAKFPGCVIMGYAKRMIK